MFQPDPIDLKKKRRSPKATKERSENERSENEIEEKERNPPAVANLAVDDLAVDDLAVRDLVGRDIQLVLLTWSYFMVVLGDPGSVPENWKPELENMDTRISGFVRPNETTETTPVVPYCTHCHNGKPPRCHHCSVCQRCVLKMDHHCIWVVNCVGARNYKFFLLFVVYTFLETTMDTFVLLPSFIEFFQDSKHRSFSAGHLALTVLAFVLNLAFALSLLCFVVMHASLVSSNTTSIEVYEKKGVARWKYDLGRRKNFEQVFGTKKALWFFPLFSKEDMENIPALHGLQFPTRSDVEV